MMKQYNVRLNATLINQLDGLGGCRSEHIRTAIRGYLQNDTQCNTGSFAATGSLAQDYIEELKKDKDILQKRLDYFMMPWYQKLLLPKP